MNQKWIADVNDDREERYSPFQLEVLAEPEVLELDAEREDDETPWLDETEQQEREADDPTEVEALDEPEADEEQAADEACSCHECSVRGDTEVDEAFADEEYDVDDPGESYDDEALDDEGDVDREEEALEEHDVGVAAPAADDVDGEAAEPIFSSTVRTAVETLLGSDDTLKAIAWNAKYHPKQSAIELARIRERLELYIDRAALLRGIDRQIAASAPIRKDDAALTAQLANQFQRKCFRESSFHTGRLDESTLDALGFVRHRGKALNTVDAAQGPAHAVLKTAWKKGMADHLGVDVTAARWYQFMVHAPFLGLTATGQAGVHLELMRHLRKAQRHLMNQAKYAAMTPIELGNILLWDPRDDAPPRPKKWTAPDHPATDPLGDRHRGVRNSTSMHGPGLAIDLSYRGSPWLGDKEKVADGKGGTRQVEVISTVTQRAALLTNGATGPGLGRAELTRLAGSGLSTGEIYDELARWNDILRAYLALRTNEAALRLKVEARVADKTRGALLGQPTVDRAVAAWTALIQKDWVWLRKWDFQTNAGIPRDPAKGFLALRRDLVIALRDGACLAWGAIDLGGGARGNGDIMHFDCRVTPLGRAYLAARNVSPPPHHPCMKAAAEREESEVEYQTPAARTKSKWTSERSSTGDPVWTFDSKWGGKAGVVVPSIAQAAMPVDVLVYLHGLSYGTRENPRCGNSANALAHIRRFELDKVVYASGKNVVLVVPSLPWETKKAAALALRTPATMNLFIAEVLAGLVNAGWSSAPALGNLYLAGHSKAYEILDALGAAAKEAASGADALANLSEVWSLDTMYSGDAPKKWLGWASQRANTKFHIYYYQVRGGTVAASQALEAAVDHCSSRKCPSNITVHGVDTTHCHIPKKHLPERLAALANRAQSP